MTPNEKQQEQRRKTLELASAYKEVFGTDGKRNHIQQKVWDSLKSFTGYEGKLTRFSPDGRVDVNQMLVIEGHREVFLRIMDFIRIAESGLETETKTTVERE